MATYISQIPPKTMLPAPTADLVSRLLELRQAWGTHWIGLETLARSCLDRLGIRADRVARADTKAVIRCFLSLAGQIEAQAIVQSQASEEPAYHSRLHLADVLLCMTELLLLSRSFSDDPNHMQREHEECLGLLVALTHDYGHDGSINRSIGQLEKRSCELLIPLLNEGGISEQDRLRVCQLILLTEPSCISNNHRNIKNKIFNINYLECLCVLINEADIMASVLPDTWPERTAALAKEWQSHSPQIAAQLNSHAGRLTILQKAALFSSPASQALGLNEIKNKEISQLLS